MGEIADAMLDGEMCEGCGEYLGGGDGFPRRCSACRRRERTKSRVPVFRAMDPNYDAFAKERRWLESASRPEGAPPSEAPAYLAKLATRGFVYLDWLSADPGAPDVYFITNRGRVELARIAASNGR